jgi:hypothetical protein
MRRAWGISIGVMLGAIMVASSALASPPADCVNKFVGSWTTTVRSTGQSYTSVIRPDGTTSASCFMCMPSQRWTCQGDTFILIDPYRVEQQLSADGTRMDGSCCFGVRQGPPPQQVTSERNPAASCEPAIARSARQYLQAAQSAARAARSEPNFANWSIADDDYTLAASLFAQCGDTANRDLAIQEREKLKADLRRASGKGTAQTPPATERRAPASCPNAAASYVKWREARKADSLGGHGYVLENSCKGSAIEVRYVTLNYGCKQETQTQRVSAGGDLPDYSYCNTPPRIVGAQFAK